MSSPHERDALLEEMLPKAMELTVVVRDRDPDGVAAVIKPLLDNGNRDRLAALLIDLAVMVPTDQPYADLLAWTHGPHVPDEVYAQILTICPEGHKRCVLCREVLAHSQFNRDRARPDGFKPRCRSCISETRLERRRGQGAA